MTTFQPGQFVVISVSGQDSGGNDAPIVLHDFDLTNHTIAYAVQTGNNITVVSRGLLGNFTMHLDFRTATGGPVPGQAIDFSVVAGEAVAAVVTVGPATSTDTSTPPIPSGW